MKLDKIFKQKKYRNLFIAIAIGVFVLLFTLFNAITDVSDGLYSNDVLPQEQNDVKVDHENTENRIVSRTLPTRVQIVSVGIDTIVSEPKSKDVSVLDTALLKGAVYYPGSGTVENGNIFIFAHSTGLSVVRNQAFKAFSNLKKIQAGDKILVTGNDGVVYRYIADSVNLVDENEALVQFDTSERMLTLSTCNTFGKKEERHVVKAHFDGIEL